MKLNIVSCTTGVLRFASESYVFLNNMRERGFIQNTHLLVWIPFSMLNEPIHPLWVKLLKDFPEAHVVFMKDYNNFQRIGNSFDYLQLFRIDILAKYFKLNPYLEKEAIFYVDTDILLTKDFDFSPYLDSGVCYLSDTNSYINASYFDSKGRTKGNTKIPEFVREDKYEEYKKLDILNECAKFAGITREICEKGNRDSGGAQYLMKGINAKFWEDVMETTRNIKMYLARVNQYFMQGDTVKEREDKGFQSWCADMWGVLWTLWRYGKEVKVVPEFDFMWATDKMEKFEKTFIFHNAGITDGAVIRTNVREDGEPLWVDAPAFFKGDQIFHEESFFEDQQYLEDVINNEVSQQWGTWLYAKEVLKTKQKYNL